MGVIEPIPVNKYHVNMDDPDIVYVGRGSPWGNEYSHVKTGTKARYRVETREDAVEAYRQDLWKAIRAGTVKRTDLMKLSGKRLPASASPKPAMQTC